MVGTDHHRPVWAESWTCTRTCKSHVLLLLQMSIGTLKHGLKGLFKAGKGGRSKSSSSAGKSDPEASLGHSISHETIDTADADSDTSSLGEYDLVSLCVSL